MAIAENMTAKIIQPLINKEKELKAELSKVVTEMAKQDIPKDVMKLWGSNCEWLRTTMQMTLHGKGYNYDNIKLTCQLPSISSSIQYLNLTPERLVIIDKLWAEIEKLKGAIEQTTSEVYNALISLGTFKRVTDQYPEAAPYLPNDSVCTGLMVQLESVREKTKCLVSQDKNCIDKL